MKTKITVFTGTRAEYGLLQPLIRRLRVSPDFDLKLLVSGTHLSPEFGSTIGQIEEKECVEPVEILLSSDTPVGVAKSFGLGVLGFTEVLSRLKPDWCLIAGDRYESLAFASTCAMLSIPIAHLHGGEVTGGSLDEHYRHAITKLSRLHFASSEESFHRIIRMGEQPDCVFNVGAIGLDQLNEISWMSRQELEANLGIRLKGTNLLVTYHPEHSVPEDELIVQFTKILNSLKKFVDTFLIFTKANSDANGRVLNRMVQDFVQERPDQRALFDSLGTRRYFSLMRAVDAVVGNSSSGLIEAPSLGVPTVNIGERQSGRLRGESVIDCNEDSVTSAIEKSLDPQFRDRIRNLPNPYGDGRTAERIIAVLREVHLSGPIKVFFDGGVP